MDEVFLILAYRLLCLLPLISTLPVLSHPSKSPVHLFGYCLKVSLKRTLGALVGEGVIGADVGEVVGEIVGGT